MAPNDGKKVTVAGAFTPLAVVFLGGLIIGVIVNFFIPLPIIQYVWIRLIGATIPLGIGIYLFLGARGAFRRHLTPLMPWEATSELVKDGPYRFTRNPIYLAFAMWYLAASFIFNSAYVLIFLLVVILLFDRLQIPREESYLNEKFGEEYARYKSRVRRWL